MKRVAREPREQISLIPLISQVGMLAKGFIKASLLQMPALVDPDEIIYRATNNFLSHFKALFNTDGF